MRRLLYLLIPLALVAAACGGDNHDMDSMAPDPLPDRARCRPQRARIQPPRTRRRPDDRGPRDVVRVRSADDRA